MDRFKRSIPSPMGVLHRTRGVHEIGMAISYSSWLAKDSDFGPQKQEGAVLALIAACLVTTDGNHSVAGFYPRLADTLDRLAASAMEARDARAMGGIRKQRPAPQEADGSALHHALMAMSREVAAKSQAHGYVGLAHIIEAVARTSDAWFRMSTTLMVCSLSHQFRAHEWLRGAEAFSTVATTGRSGRMDARLFVLASDLIKEF